MFDSLYDGEVSGNKIVRHYNSLGFFNDLSVDEAIAKKLNYYKGWSCSAGVHHFYVNFDGYLYRGNCRAGGRLGNVYREDYEIPKEWYKCPYELCGCGADLLAPKAKTEGYQKKLTNTFNPKVPLKIQRLKNMKRPVAVETAFPSTMKKVQWDIGRRCNYDCSYCWPEIHNNHEPLKSYEMMRKAIDTFVARVSGGEPMFFMFGGGEPTLYPKFDQLMDEMGKEGHQMTVTTNGSRNAKYFAKLIEYCNINVSVHFESADWDRLLHNFEAMIEKRKQGGRVGGLEIKLMVPPGFMEKAKAFKEEMFKIPEFEKYVTWSYVPLRNLGKYGESPEKSAVLQSYEKSEFKNFEDQV